MSCTSKQLHHEFWRNRIAKLAWVPVQEKVLPQERESLVVSCFTDLWRHTVVSAEQAHGGQGRWESMGVFVDVYSCKKHPWKINEIMLQAGCWQWGEEKILDKEAPYHQHTCPNNRANSPNGGKTLSLETPKGFTKDASVEETESSITWLFWNGLRSPNIWGTLYLSLERWGG